MPWRVLPAVGAVLGFIAGSLLRIRRAHVEGAMRAAGVASPRSQARAMYRALGTSAIELLYLASHGPGATAHVRLGATSAARWREALARGRGAVIAASHTGNWDLAACAVARETELLVVTKRLSVGWLDRFWQSTRAGLGVALVEAAGALARARGVLRRGGAVAMIIDQVPTSAGHAIEVPFLGRAALVDRGPAALAAACRAPLVVAASRREPTGEHALLVLQIIEPPPRPSPRWVADATRAATRALEDFVREHPSQWLWLHRRWKRLDRRTGTATLAPPWPEHEMPPATSTTARSRLRRRTAATRSSSRGAASRAG
ncbi:MAG TPA: lysophospholipid acyltransferase family protein [Polyangiaceae bacterium]|nr:lysophospholipid acyltransferase family protein [Polyangiaceae bacterium]